MYKNIGKKIKGMAIAMFVIEAIGGIATGIAMGMSGGDTFVATVITVTSPFVAWVSSWITYGFGELVDNSAGNVVQSTERGIKITIDKKCDDVTVVDHRGITKLLEEGLEKGKITQEQFDEVTKKVLR